MGKKISEAGAAEVFAAQVMAIIALANALVECGAVKSEALIASLEGQMEKMRADGFQAKTAMPIANLIRALRYEQGKIPKPH